jgi:hypothetical protein
MGRGDTVDDRDRNCIEKSRRCSVRARERDEVVLMLKGVRVDGKINEDSDARRMREWVWMVAMVEGMMSMTDSMDRDE